MNRLLGRDEVARPPGVIDTLTAGYETINRRLWLLLLPVSLDLLFWLGPKLSIVRLAGYLPAGALSPEQPAAVAETLAHFNLAVLLALYVPTALGGRAPLGPAGPDVSYPIPRAVYPLAPETFALAVAILLPLGLLVAGLYLGGIGQAVRAETPGRGAVGAWLRVGLRCCGRLMALHVAGLLALLALVVPWTVAIALVARVSPAVGGLLLLLFQVGALWVGFHFFFALNAVVLTDAHPVRAALSSVRVVRANFWSAMALVGLILLISAGLGIVWRALSGQPVGVVASIAGNAYIGTGLAAASMLYYRDRVRLLRGQTIGND